MHPSSTDTKPWYKQFWPWFIIALPSSAVIAGIITVVIAFKNADSLVVDDYYKEGLAINSRIALIKKARELGLLATMQRLEGGHLFLSFKSGTPVTAQLQLDFVHPTKSEKDFSVTFNRLANGNYQAVAPVSTEGRWYLRLSANDVWLIKTEIDSNATSVDFIPAVP